MNADERRYVEMNAARPRRWNNDFFDSIGLACVLGKARHA